MLNLKRKGVKINKENFTTLAALYDLHYPYHDKKIVKLVIYKFLPELQPEYLIIGGDWADFFGLSKFSKDPRRALNTQKDLDGLYTILKDIRQMLPNTEIIYLEGNHEFRLIKYKWTRCPEMAYIRALTVPKLLRLDELNIKYISYNKYWEYKKLYFVHGDVISKHSGQTAKNMLDKWGVNVICGHSHRTGKHNKTTLNGNQGAWESGCLCDLNPEYIKGKANWMHGMSIVEYYKDKIFYVHNIDIVKYSFIYDGKYWNLDDSVVN